MLARVIHKLILSCSVIAAVAVIVLAARCRRDGDLLVCGARFGTYHELRADSGGVSWMQLAGWPILNDPLQSGRAKPKPSTISNWSEVIKNDRAVPLIDGVQLHLVAKRPAAKGASSWWWPPPWIGSAGTATMHEPTEKYLRTFTTATRRGPIPIAATGTVTIAPAPPTTWPSGSIMLAPATTRGVAIAALTRKATTLPVSRSISIAGTSGSGTINFSGPMTLSLAPPPTPAARSTSGGGLLATIQGTASNLTITRTVPPPAKNTWGTGTISGMTVRLTPTFAYDRIALPYWPVVAIVLTPAWISALVALARARRGIMRRRRGLCVKCGYDLRGSAFESACPECGVAFKRDQKNAEAAAATTTS